MHSPSTRIPDFLAPYRAQIEPYRLDFIRITARPLSDGEVLPPAQSKFLGSPYLPQGAAYPADKKGRPMVLWAQINFSEVPHLEDYPREGILQLFVTAQDWYDMDDYTIRYYPDATRWSQPHFHLPTDDPETDSPIQVAHALSFSKEAGFGGIEDCRFDPAFDGLPYADYYETLTADQQQQLDDFFRADGHRIGGYAYFTQFDPRACKGGKKTDVLLLQIDTDEQIMFGDSGVANVFISAADLAHRRFDQAYLNWDCC